MTTPIYIVSVSGGKDSTAAALHRADRIDTWCGKCRGTGILDGAACETCKGKGSRLEIPTIPIRARLEWAWTSRGGSQMRMDLPEDSGCMRWGMCDTAGDPD